MSLSAGATLAQIVTEYETTANWLATDSVAQARLHAIAIRFLLVRMPATAIKGSNTVHYDTRMLRDELKSVENFVKTRGAGNIIYADFRQTRRNG